MYKNQLVDKRMLINQKYFTKGNEQKYENKIMVFFTKLLTYFPEPDQFKNYLKDFKTNEDRTKLEKNSKII